MKEHISFITARLLCLVLLPTMCGILYGKDADNSTPPAAGKKFTDYVSCVDPRIETGYGRWFFCTPGSRPFGMICASAYTVNQNQKGGGYNYNHTDILGFVQIHGWMTSALDLMPTTGKVDLCKGTDGWKSSFSHEGEIIEPGYHRLFLDRYKTEVEYSSTDRVVFYRLTHKESAEANLLLSLGGYFGSVYNVSGQVTKESNQRIEGSVEVTGRKWGGPKRSPVFFVMELDRPFDQMDGWKGPEERLTNIEKFRDTYSTTRTAGKKRSRQASPDRAGISLAYKAKAGDKVQVKIAVSYTSLENARNNLKQECDHWDFDGVRKDSRKEWNQWLGKIDVRGGLEKTRVKFYTDLWHVLLGRHKIDDFSGDYPGYENPPNYVPAPKGETGHKPNWFGRDDCGTFHPRTLPKDNSGKQKFHMYNSDALWLTMWNLNILWGLGWPEMMDNFSASMVQYAEDRGTLPRGPTCGGYTWIMCGCPATSLITATWQKQLLTKVDAEVAYQAMKRSHPRLLHEIDLSHASPLVEGAFEYWALAQMAEEMGKTDDVKSYQEWIHAWKQIYNPATGLLEHKPMGNKKGGWVESGPYTGTFGVSHDIAGLATLMGGNDKLAAKLVNLFEIGKCKYQNQPVCSAAHVFNHVDHPWLSQYWVRQVSRETFGAIDPDNGYGRHDEDQGQMGGVSALMKLGLFSLRGTSSKEPVYEITAPEFDEITIHLDSRYYPGKTFRIKTHGNPAEHYYIQKAQLNGKPLNSFRFPHKDFAQGGLLEIWVGPEPNEEWGIESNKENR